MSNQVTIQRTVFTDYIPDKDSTPSFGYRIYDDNGQEYDNSLTKEQMDLPDDAFLRYIRDNGGTVSSDMIEWLTFMDGKGVNIDGKWYDNEWVKKALDTEEITELKLTNNPIHT